jgi:hypothetical protein
MRVFISGPYTQGDPAVNVASAIAAADHLTALGHVPFVPHLYHFWHMMKPHDYEFWMALDLEWLRVCDAILRLPGYSPGADKETAQAAAWGIPVYDSLSALELV